MKKSFIDSIENPAEVFISAPTAASTLDQTTQVPQGYKLVPAETRSKRVQVLMRPNLYKQLKARAKREKRSVNDLINYILEGNTNNRSDNE